MQKQCNKHGLTDFVLEKRGYYRCKKCRSAQVTKSRRKRKKKLVEYFGGRCTSCGYDRCQEALQFHHIDPKEKEFNISKDGITRSWVRMLAEAKKCALVCANCHAEIEAGIINS